LRTRADLILRGGAVHTVDARLPRATAVAVRDGVIVAVGEDDVRPLDGAGTEVVDLAGRALFPGFQDGHAHPSGGGLERTKCDLTSAHSLDGYLAIIASYAEANPDVGWITGGGWSMDVFARGVPDKVDLDRVVPDRPVFLSNRDHHAAWVNTVAMERAGVTATTADPPDGRIERDTDGVPNGTLQEGAMALVQRVVPAPSVDDIAAGTLEGQRYLHSFGVTSWQEAIVGDYPVTPDCYDAYLDLDAAGQLTGRIVGALWWDRTSGVAQLDRLLERRDSAARCERFRATSVKFMQDGVCENFTAAMLAPYLDGTGGHTHTSGTSFFDPEELKEYVARVDAAGFQAHFHAIGDRAVREVLDAVAAARRVNGPNDNRHCAAHIQVVHPDDVPRFAVVGMVANAQPLWACNEPQMVELTVPFIGPERAATQYPFASIVATGAKLCFGSDWPVSTPNPLAEMHVAVNRVQPPGEGPAADPLLPDEAVSLDVAIEAFTMGTAYLNHQEQTTGSITVGKRADLVVLDQDPYAVPSGEIGTVGVDLTFVDGRCVYERASR
jgi:predicted amidohydrolase YtcJ